jgi:hypothetical protein
MGSQIYVKISGEFISGTPQHIPLYLITPQKRRSGIAGKALRRKGLGHRKKS